MLPKGNTVMMSPSVMSWSAGKSALIPPPLVTAKSEGELNADFP